MFGGRRSAVSSVAGMLLFVVVFMAALGTMAYLTSLQAQSTQMAQQAQQLLNQHGKESLTYQARSDGTLAVANNGPASSTVAYVVLKFANGTVCGPSSVGSTAVTSGTLLSVPALLPSGNCGSSTWLSKYNAILASTNVGDSIAVVTSLGNVFWEKPAQSVQASTPGTTVQMTFSATGDSAFASNPVLIVDGATYTQAQLPATTTWFVGTKHNYAWQALPQGTGTRVGATVTGFAQSQSGTITATSSGAIAATFTTQYLLTLTGGSGVTVSPSSPTGDGYYPAGTGVQITAPNVWNVVAGQSRSNLVSYSLDGASPASVTRSGAGNLVYSLTMNNPHTLAFNYVTQYYVTLQNGVPTSGTLPEIVTSYSYIGPVTNPQAASNPNFNGGLSPWIPVQSNGGCGGCTAISDPGSSAYLQVVCNFVSSSCSNYAEVYQVLQNPPSGVTYTSATFTASISVNTYLVGGFGSSNFCIWISGGSSTCTTSGSSVTATWTGSTTAVPSVYAEATAWDPGGSGNFGAIFVYVNSVTWSLTYTTSLSGTTTSSTQASYSVVTNTVTYTYNVGYNFPSGSSSTSWSATVPSSETYVSNTCSGATVSGATLSSVTGGTCSVRSTGTGTYGSSVTSPTGDGYFDAGTLVTITASTSGVFSFGSWATTDSANLPITSSTSASTTVQVSGFGTITANFNVNQ